MSVMEFLEPEFLRECLKTIRDNVSVDKPLEYTVSSGRKLVIPTLMLLTIAGQLWASGDVEAIGELVVV